MKVESYLFTQFGIRVKRIIGDNTAEHKPLAEYAATKGTIWDPIPPYTSQLNGVAEIKNRYLIEPLIAILAKYNLPKYL